jgi:hypothetical protein
MVPVMALAERAGLPELLAEHVRPGGGCGVNAPAKVGCLVAGMAAGADSIDDMGLLRHGAMGVLFSGVRARPRSAPTCAPIRGGTCCSWRRPGAGAAGPAAPPGAAAAGRGRARLRGHRLHAETGLRAQEGRLPLRPHQDPGQVSAGPRVERAGRRGQHPAGRPGRRGHTAARRERALGPRRGQPRRPGHRRRPRQRRHRDDRRADGLGLLRRLRHRRGPPRRRAVLRHRPVTSAIRSAIAAIGTAEVVTAPRRAPRTSRSPSRLCTRSRAAGGRARCARRRPPPR